MNEFSHSRTRQKSGLGQTSRLSMDDQAVSTTKEGNSDRVRKMKCRARGVSADHDAGNGYYLVPEGLPHGSALVCSFPECGAEKRRRFQYCKFCDAPATSRNFKHRHGHGESGSELKSQAKKPRTIAHGGLADDDSSLIFGDAQEDDKLPASPLHVLDSSTENIGFMRHAARSSRQHNSSAGEKRTLVELNQTELSWLELLRTRPNTHDNDGMHKWMEQILQVSEPLNAELASLTPDERFGTGLGSNASATFESDSD